MAYRSMTSSNKGARISISTSTRNSDSNSRATKILGQLRAVGWRCGKEKERKRGEREREREDRGERREERKERGKREGERDEREGEKERR